jgi:hypothetical protein
MVTGQRLASKDSQYRVKISDLKKEKCLTGGGRGWGVRKGPKRSHVLFVWPITFHW